MNHDRAPSAAPSAAAAGEARELVFASSNAGKIRELEELLSPLGWRVRAQREFGVTDADETGLSFVENALLKARHACEGTGRPAVADDSGLEVDALGGEPGLYSSRFAAQAGHGDGDRANCDWLLERLAAMPPETSRRARFRSVVVRLRHARDPAPLIAEGVWEGSILHEPAGAGGFGYDPLFRSDDTGCAAALLEPATKNALSHRGKAVARLVELLRAESIAAGAAGP